MKTKNNIILIGIMALAMVLGGCKKFLDVEPKTSLSEEQFFTSEQGFRQALNGVYSQLAARNLYTDKLSMGYVSALAQNYNITTANSSINLVETIKLNYLSDEAEGHSNAIWSSAYAAIANLNKIIDNTNLNRAVLSEGNSYSLIRGEALALRALLHFDLFRLFGKEYLANIKEKALPYRKAVNGLSIPPVTTEEFINFVLADLKEAENLLKETDPIVTEDLRTRKDHLNYYGVKGLEARVRITIGDKPGAAAAALVVVNSGKYPFVTPEAAGAAENRDRLYFTEQVFMVRSGELRNWTESYFRASTQANVKLTRSTANFNTLYETATPLYSEDIRYKFRIESDAGLLFPSKFWQGTSTTFSETRLDQYVPVIRVSEMYYILAETATTPAEGIAYLNMVRVARRIPALTSNNTATQVTTELLKEYKKEFWAEGQLFFYYKRTNATTMQFKAAPTAVTPAMYVVPIPDAELQYNPNY